MPARQRPTRTQRPADKPGVGGGAADNDDADYRDLIQIVRDMLANERLHVPPKIEEDEYDLPFNLTTLSDKQLQEAYSAFGAYSYRAGYLLLEHEAVASKCREAADEIVTRSLATTNDDDGTVTQMKAVAEQNEVVKTWRKRQRTHTVLADAQRKQRDNYDKVCERLSRLESMRHQEWERSGNRLAARKGAK